MPTLVDTRNSTTKWAGEPLVVSSADPFSAQTEIAEKVVGALQLALKADEKKDLAERPTDNPQAYDAYLRGKATLDAVFRTSVSIRDVDQAIAELQRATTLDPKFAKAWALLAGARFGRAVEVPGDTVSMRLVGSRAEPDAAGWNPQCQSSGRCRSARRARQVRRCSAGAADAGCKGRVDEGRNRARAEDADAPREFCLRGVSQGAGVGGATAFSAPSSTRRSPARRSSCRSRSHSLIWSS